MLICYANNKVQETIYETIVFKEPKKTPNYVVIFFVSMLCIFLMLYVLMIVSTKAFNDAEKEIQKHIVPLMISFVVIFFLYVLVFLKKRFFNTDMFELLLLIIIVLASLFTLYKFYLNDLINSTIQHINVKILITFIFTLVLLFILNTILIEYNNNNKLYNVICMFCNVLTPLIIGYLYVTDGVNAAFGDLFASRYAPFICFTKTISLILYCTLINLLLLNGIDADRHLRLPKNKFSVLSINERSQPKNTGIKNAIIKNSFKYNG